MVNGKCGAIAPQQIIRFATLGIPGYHCLWPVFPNCSARIAILYNLTQADGRACLIPHYLLQVVRDGYLFVTTPVKYSSTNLST